MNSGQRTPRHMLFQWHITEHCNLRCSHCYQKGQRCSDPSWDDLMVVLDQFKKFSHRSRHRAGSNSFPVHVTVTGGEPFLRADFLTLLKRLRAQAEIGSFAILTNGTMITRQIARELSCLKPGFIQVSIDGSRETHDRIRGAGSYDRAAAGLRLLVREDIPTHISFTAHRANFREFPDVVRLGRRLGVNRVWSDRMVPCGRGADGHEFLLNPDETREYIGLMQKEKERSRFRRSPVALIRSLQFTAAGTRPYRCTAADSLVAVLPNGDICPCRRMPLIAGNLYQDELETVYGEADIFRALRTPERSAPECSGCFYSRTCNGGARCLAAAVYGDPFRPDPGCWLAKKSEERLS